MIRSGAINWGNPINRSCGLNAGLVSDWLARPGISGNTLYDSAGINHGTLTSSPTWTTTTRPGTYRCLNSGGSGYVVCGDYVLGSAAFTLMAWVYQTTAGSGGLLARATIGSVSRLASIDITSAGNVVQFQLYDGTNNPFARHGVSIAGRWYHVAAVRDTAATLIRLYVDGIEATNAADSAGTVDGGSQRIEILRRPDNTAVATALIDDARLYRVAKSASEILGIVNDARAGYPLTLNRIEQRWGYAAAAAGPAFNPLIGPLGRLVGYAA